MNWKERAAVLLSENASHPLPTKPTKAPFGSLGSTGGGTFRVEKKSIREHQEALSTACVGLSISPAELYDALAPEDIEEWRKGDISGDTLAAFARSLVQRREMDRGQVPAHYTERATCRHCGPVWLWFAGEVEGCPWCWNRAGDHPIPRPMI